MHWSLRGLDRTSIIRESFAGLALLAISVPLNIGYAQIAGLPMTAGLYALVVPTLVHVALTSSRHVVASPDAAAAALVFSSLVGLGIGEENFAEMAAAQAILCGVMLLSASVLRWGFLASFLSHPILIGFIAGLALEALIGQVWKMRGVLLGAGAVRRCRRARTSITAMAKARGLEEVAAAAPHLPGWPQAVYRFTPTRAEAPLQRHRAWIVTNNGVISAGFLAFVAFTQIQKAIQAWV